MEFNKKLNKHGAVSLPVALRRDFGIEPGTKFNISVNPSNGSVILKQIEGACLFCGSDQGLTVFQGRHICQGCANSIHEAQVNGK